MLTDEELIDRLRQELQPLRPPADLVDRLREQANTEHADRRLRRSRTKPGARLTRALSLAPIAICIALAFGIGGGALAVLSHRHEGPATQLHPPAGRILVLTGSGLGKFRFGADPQQLRQLLDPLLGSPTGGYRPTVAECGVDGAYIWPIVLDPRTGRLERSEELLLTFEHRRFVGYQYGGDDSRLPRHPQRLRLRAATTRGLAVGESLATARRLYGQAFRISAAQGGSWQTDTPQGTLRGYVYDISKRGVTSTSNLIASIDGGDVGCPAVSP